MSSESRDISYYFSDTKIRDSSTTLGMTKKSAEAYLSAAGLALHFLQRGLRGVKF